MVLVEKWHRRIRQRAQDKEPRLIFESALQTQVYVAVVSVDDYCLDNDEDKSLS
jgi:hypothetical protein